MRTIFEKMGAEVSYNSSTKTITATKNDKTIKMQINSKKLYRDDTEIDIDAPPIIVKSTTLVPLRVIAECFDSDVLSSGSEYFEEAYILTMIL